MSDATFHATNAAFGARGVIDLIGVMGANFDALHLVDRASQKLGRLGNIALPVSLPALLPPFTATCHVGNRATGRPNRSYKIGTTMMFSAVELNRPNMITIAIGA